MDATAELLDMTRVAAENAGVPFELLAGLVQTESAWNPRATSGVGARGLTQVMPWWLTSDKFRAYGLTPDDLYDPQTALWLGSEILADELRRFSGDWALAAMAYNGGSPVVSKAIKATGTTDPDAVSSAIKSAETRNYWGKVLKWAAYFANRASALEASATEVLQDTKTAIDAQGGPVLLVFLGIAAALLMASGRHG